MLRMRRVSGTHRFKFEVPVTAVSAGTNSFSAGTTSAGFDDVINFGVAAGPSVNYASYAWAFQLFDMNISQQSLIASFDRYILGPIVAHVWPGANCSLVGPQNGLSTGSMAVQYACMFDHDDFAAPGNTVAVWNNFRSRSGCKQRRGTRACRFLIKPTNLGVIADTNLATTTSARAVRSGWMDSAFVKPLHFGFKMMWQFFNPSAGTCNWQTQIRFTYYVRGQTILV